MLLNIFQEEEVQDDTEEYEDSYFSEEPSTFTRSVADPPSGLLDMFNKDKVGKLKKMST